MKRIIIVLSVALCITMIFAGISLYRNLTVGIRITIINETDVELSDIYFNLNMSHHQSDTKISILEVDKEYKLNIIPPALSGEGELKIYYYDIHGTEQEFMVIGYLESSYRMKSNITISSIDDNGILEFEVDNK